MEFERLGYTFRYFFDADVDELGHVDVEGFDVYDGDVLIAELNFLTKDEIDAMDDETLEGLIEDSEMLVKIQNNWEELTGDDED